MVNGKRLKNDEKNFTGALSRGTQYGQVIKMNPSDCSIINKWLGNHPIFFDFGVFDHGLDNSILWVLLPKHPDRKAYLYRLLAKDFIEMHATTNSPKLLEFENVLDHYQNLIKRYNSTP